MSSTSPQKTIALALSEATQRLQVISETPRLDAELLLSHALQISRAQLLARLRDTMPVCYPFEEALRRRLDYEPIAYIVGEWEFFSLSFLTRAPMLTPRPETEHLVEVTLDAATTLRAVLKRPLRILELGCGSGCVAVSVAHNLPDAQVTATDINPDALALTHENAVRHNVAVQLYEGDLFTALPSDNAEAFDILVSNPPYVESGVWDSLSPVIQRHEDPRALLAGEDGLDIIRRIIHDAPAYLHPHAFIALEIGEKQFDAVAELLQEDGFSRCFACKDLAGIQRIAYAWKTAPQP